MAGQVSITFPKGVLALLKGGTSLGPQWELVYLAMVQSRVAGRTELAAELESWLDRMNKLAQMKNELINYERAKSINLQSPGSGSSRGS